MILNDTYVRDSFIQAMWFEEKPQAHAVIAFLNRFIIVECTREAYLKSVRQLTFKED